MLPALKDGKRDLKAAEVMSARFAPPAPVEVSRKLLRSCLMLTLATCEGC